MQADVAPTDHGALLDGHEQFLVARDVFLRGDDLRKIEVVPAENGVFAQAPAPLSNLFNLFTKWLVTNPYKISW
jgi:hypothetical protein